MRQLRMVSISAGCPSLVGQGQQWGGRRVGMGGDRDGDLGEDGVRMRMGTGTRIRMEMRWGQRYR